MSATTSERTTSATAVRAVHGRGPAGRDRRAAGAPRSDALAGQRDGRRPVATPPPGNSRSCSPRRSEPHSGRFASRLWHIPFNRVNDTLTEELVRGREDIFFGHELAGHWVAEQAPDEMLAALTEFLAPYRDGG
jgi:hypothetical protein